MSPNFDQAFRRHRTRQMDRDAACAASCTAQIENRTNENHAEGCNGTEIEDEKSWFLPHFAVTNPNKPGKVRLVFDAAAVSDSMSLNQQLLEGPDLLQSLPGILFRFREKPIAVTADIQEMFLQIKIRNDDQPAQMFLWRGRDRQNSPKKYKMTSLIFGASSSPFLAHSVRNQNAEDFARTHPLALEAITKSHYMDDFVDSFDSQEEAKRTVDEVDFVHRQAGFHLRGWNSNDRSILVNIPVELHAHSLTQVVPEADNNEKTLGLLWDAEKDELGFNTSMNRVPTEVKEMSRAPTKRETLSAVMSIYDPLGILSPFTIAAKILLQSLWRLNIGWDEPIPQEEAEQFFAWLRGLNNISLLRLPRCYDPGGTYERRDLHISYDATEQAYAAVATWRIERKDGSVEITEAASRAKAAPGKINSIPRMEQASVVSSREADADEREHRWTAEIPTYWQREIAERWSARQGRGIVRKCNIPDEVTCTNSADGRRREWLTGLELLRQPRQCWLHNPQEGNGKGEEKEFGVQYVAIPQTLAESCQPPECGTWRAKQATVKRAAKGKEHAYGRVNAEERSVHVHPKGSVCRRLRRKLVVLPVEG